LFMMFSFLRASNIARVPLLLILVDLVYVKVANVRSATTALSFARLLRWLLISLLWPTSRSLRLFLDWRWHETRTQRNAA
jgi:hypothetical protein